MNSLDVKVILRDYLKEALSEKALEIKDDSLLFEDGYIDSIGFVALFSFIERKFEFTMLDEDFTQENHSSLNTIAEFILLKLKR